MRRGWLLIAVFFVASVCTAAAAPERVDIPAGAGSTLKALVFRPKGSGPFPAIVALHGCAGLSGRSELRTLYRDWGERLSAQGFLVMFPDSYGSRGLGSQCRARMRPVRASRERVADANAARLWLAQQPSVNAERISLLGWAGGGVAALWAIRPHAKPKDGRPDFRAAAVLYPSCRSLNEAAWSARAPTLILIGAADDWAPANLCQQMVRGAYRRSARVSVITYPNAHHDFDHPNLPLREQTGLATTADGSGRAHSGTNPSARADALRRVPQWFSR